MLSHGSMSSYEYDIQKKFVIEVADKLGVAPGQSQAAVVQFSDSASLKAQLGQYTTIARFTEVVNALRQEYGIYRRFDEALHLAATELQQRGRNDVPKLVLLLTNGYPFVNDRKVFSESSQPLKNDGVHILAVGVGYTPKDLLQLVTVDDNDIFMVKSFQELRPTVGKIIDRVCYLIGKCHPNSDRVILASN